MFPAVWGQHLGLPLLRRHQRHSFLHLQRAQNLPAELACLLSQRSCLEARHPLLDRPLLYPFLLLLHLCLEALHRLLVRQPLRLRYWRSRSRRLGYRCHVRQLGYRFQLPQDLCLEALRHL